MDYGYFLNKAYDNFIHEKDTGKIEPNDLTFQHWLADSFYDDNVGISDSYARKLRKIAVDFYGYYLHRLKVWWVYFQMWQLFGKVHRLKVCQVYFRWVFSDVAALYITLNFDCSC